MILACLGGPDRVRPIPGAYVLTALPVPLRIMILLRSVACWEGQTGCVLYLVHIRTYCSSCAPHNHDTAKISCLLEGQTGCILYLVHVRTY